jgi:hypothetical protein
VTDIKKQENTISLMNTPLYSFNKFKEEIASSIVNFSSSAVLQFARFPSSQLLFTWFLPGLMGNTKSEPYSS